MKEGTKRFERILLLFFFGFFNFLFVCVWWGVMVLIRIRMKS